jgi:hypothetical protein
MREAERPPAPINPVGGRPPVVAPLTLVDCARMTVKVLAEEVGCESVGAGPAPALPRESWASDQGKGGLPKPRG